MSLQDAVDELTSRSSILVGVDFDGTLAPLVDHPDLAVPDPRAISLLRVIAQRPGVKVAIVSGRSLTDLRNRVGDVPGASLIGEHGNDDGALVPAHPTLEQAKEFVNSLKRDYPDATVEAKLRSVTFHTRGLDGQASADAISRVRAWVARHGGLTLLEGKQVLELSVASRNKGDAVRHLARHTNGVLFIGDDTTDEAVFEILGDSDVGVKVGEGETAARYRVAGVAEVVGLLERVALTTSGR